jgi:hypothetical protein
VETFVLILAGSAVIAGAGFAIAWAVRRESERIETWKQLAVDRGGVFIDKRGWASSRGIEVQSGNACAFIDTYTVSTGKSSTTYTRGRVRYPIVGGPVYRVYREGVLSAIGKALGAQDVALGIDPVFDDLFIVKCDRPEVVRKVWSPRCQQLMRTALQDCRIESDGKEIKVVALGAWRERHRLEAMLDLLLELGQVDFYGDRALRSLQDGSYVPAGGHWKDRTPPRYEVTFRATPFSIGPALDRRRVCTLIVAPPAGHHEQLRYRIGNDTPPEPLQKPELERQLRKLDGVELHVDSKSCKLIWPTIEHDHGRLQSGLELLAALLAPPSRGVFR